MERKKNNFQENIRKKNTVQVRRQKENKKQKMEKFVNEA